MSSGRRAGTSSCLNDGRRSLCLRGRNPSAGATCRVRPRGSSARVRPRL
jgi:hypothetical protein